VENLHKAFGDFAAVKDSTFTIADGSFFCLLGPSGCGKTTTLRMIAGLELPTSGSIFLDGEDVAFRRASERDIAFVFQLFALYPHMNVRQNIAFPLKCQGVPSAETRARVEETARLLRIDHLIDKPVSGLSGGDRQRVALGRAIVRRPKAFLMDEPLGTLDSEFRHLMCQELRALHNRIGATTVYVTHDQLEAMSMADTIAIMNHGVVEQIGPPQEVYDRPATIFVADFVGSPPMNFLPVAGPAPAGASSIEVDGVKVAIPRLAGAAHGRELVLGVRPEHIRLDGGSGFRAEVTGTEYLGTTQILTLKSAAGGLKARVAATHRVARGDTVGLSFEAGKLSLFDKASGLAIRSTLHEHAAAPNLNRSRRPQAPGAAHG
jgi:multiple sugar transport system ATP-binding protein